MLQPQSPATFPVIDLVNGPTLSTYSVPRILSGTISTLAMAIEFFESKVLEHKHIRQNQETLSLTGVQFFQTGDSGTSVP